MLTCDLGAVALDGVLSSVFLPFFLAAGMCMELDFFLQERGIAVK